MSTSEMDDHGGKELTIDELARRAGVVASTVRMYQNKGLLPPPTKRGRVGYYDNHHLQRLRAIGQLQERGFSLAAIQELLDGAESGESLRSVLGLDLGSIWEAEPAQTMSFAELTALLPSVEFTPAMVQRVVDLDLVSLAEDGTHVVVHSPSFLKIGSELAARGVPGEEILDEYERLRVHTDEIARQFTELFRRHMWEPFATRGMPNDLVAPLVQTLDELAPMAERVTDMALRHSLQASAETFIRDETERLGIETPGSGDREHGR